MKKCSCCHEIKPLVDFYKTKRNLDGYCGYCIACDKLKKAAHYQKTREQYIARASKFSEENRDKVRAYKRKWKKKNPEANRVYKNKRRAQESIEHFTVAQWRDLLEATGNVCLACGSSEKISADHVIPLALGGSNSIKNIQPLCVDCNCKKGIGTTDYREI